MKESVVSLSMARRVIVQHATEGEQARAMGMERHRWRLAKSVLAKFGVLSIKRRSVLDYKSGGTGASIVSFHKNANGRKTMAAHVPAALLEAMGAKRGAQLTWKLEGSKAVATVVPKETTCEPGGSAK
jgi:hypothetical protein